MMVLSLLINYVRIYMQAEKALSNTIRGIVILHTPYHILGDVQVEIIEISHVEDMDHSHRQPHCSNATYGQSTYWRAIGIVHILDSILVADCVRASACHGACRAGGSLVAHVPCPTGLVADCVHDRGLRVRYIANTREELLLDNNVWEEEGYLEGWSKWVRVCRWYYRPIMDVVKALCKGSISYMQSGIEHICSK